MSAYIFRLLRHSFTTAIGTKISNAPPIAPTTMPGNAIAVPIKANPMLPTNSTTKIAPENAPDATVWTILGNLRKPRHSIAMARISVRQSVIATLYISLHLSASTFASNDYKLERQL